MEVVGKGQKITRPAVPWMAIPTTAGTGAEATRNAKDQASKFAAEAGATLGPLKNANQGAIRISGDDGNDFDDGSSRIKRLRVVSTFEYELR